MFKRISVSFSHTAKAHLYASTSAASTIVEKIHQSVADLPMREYAQYSSTGQKFSAESFLRAAKDHANALLEHRWKSGETLALWLPEKFPERDVILLAAAQAGYRVVDINANLTNIHKFREALAIANPKIIYFFPKKNDINYIKLLRKSIPEFFHYDDTKGQIFHSKHFLNLRWFIHLGPEVELGAIPFDNLFFPQEPKVSRVDRIIPHLSDSFPIYTRIYRKEGPNGEVVVEGPIELGKVLEAPEWTFAKKLIDKEYVEF